MTEILAEIRAVSRQFETPLTLTDRLLRVIGRGGTERRLQAVADVSLQIARGEALGLVGESGCGKSTLGRMVAGILAPSTGKVFVEGKPVLAGSGRKLTTRVQMVFQDPFTSLNPRLTVGEQIGEGALAHGLVTRANLPAYIGRWLGAVGLRPDHASRYPHQFSGGQRQRVAIARALAMQPAVLVCDEPVASLDVSVQAQIINLLLSLKRDLGLTMLFISHDLSVVRHLCDRIAVMYLGRIVEIGDTEKVCASPRHPYTRALLACRPRLNLDSAPPAMPPIAGELSSALNLPAGCAFSTRCANVGSLCRDQAPSLRQIEPAQQVACHYPGLTLANEWV
jgi:oligopeptide/dipeptide ABC transporter ATP-binding protein